MTSNPLGAAAEAPSEYAPEVLFAVPRSEARVDISVGVDLPFHGVDLWNCYELTWLDADGRPAVAIATFRFPADAPNIVESKSMKLYLNSLAMTRYTSEAALLATIGRDIGRCSGSAVEVSLSAADDPAAATIVTLPGDCIDALPIEPPGNAVDAGLLATVAGESREETLYSHLLRSICPVTAQPDSGSVLIRYQGAPIERASLLRYLVSYRGHRAFHEACVERMFVDIRERCATERLTVYARYSRRGGIDINPFRSDFEREPGNPRLWRQ